MKHVFKSSVSIIALCVMVETGWGMPGADDEEGFKGRYTIGKDWDEDRSITSNAFTERSNRSSKKEGLTYDEDDEWERGTARTDLDNNYNNLEIGGQKLTDIPQLMNVRFFGRGFLKITSENYQDLLKYKEFYVTAFRAYDDGVIIKGWKSSLSFNSLTNLLYAFRNLKILKFNITWDTEEGDVSAAIVDALPFYKNLTKLNIANCRITDKAMTKIRKSIPAPEKLETLDVRGNPLSKDTLINLKKHFPNLTNFKSNITLEESQHTENPSSASSFTSVQKKDALEGLPDEKRLPINVLNTSIASNNAQARSDQSNLSVIFIKNKATNLILNSNSKRGVYTSNNLYSWKAETFDKDYYLIIDNQTCLVLDSNSKCQVYTSNNNDKDRNNNHRLWKLEKFDLNYYLIRNKATSSVLDSNFEHQVYTSNNNDQNKNNNHRLWELETSFE